MTTMMYIWLAVFIVSLVIELLAPALVSIWFTCGALISFLFSLFLKDNAIWLQVVIFALVSLATIILLRPLIKKASKKSKTNVDSLIDEIGVCEEDIKHYSLGEVKINGLVWNALINDDQEEIKKGDLVSIVEIKGNKLLVKKFVKEDK